MYSKDINIQDILEDIPFLPLALEDDVRSESQSLTRQKAKGIDRISIKIWQAMEEKISKGSNLIMPANVENYTVGNRLEEVSLYTKPEKQDLTEWRLLYNILQN